MDKAKRNALSIDTKTRILAEVDKNVRSKSEIAKEFNISCSTLSTVLKNREKILEADKSGSRKRKRTREAKWPALEQALVEWVKKMRNSNIPVDGKLLHAKAETFALRMNLEEDMRISNGWIQRFKERNGLVFRKLCGESASVNQEDAAEWKTGRLQELLSAYSAEDVYNADETGLFYKLLPDRSLIFQSETANGGKRAKQRISVLLGANMAGTDKLELLVIGKYKKPRCFKGIRSLPVDYHSNNKAWMTSDIFESWLRKLDQRMFLQKRKILLILDNCSAHVNIDDLRAVQIEFLPANMTSVLQPMDQGVIQCLKKHYRRMLLNRIVLNLENGKDYSVTLLSAIHLINASWDQVSRETIQNCFRHAGFCSKGSEPSDRATTAITSTEEDELLVKLRENRIDVPNDMTFVQYAECDNNLECSAEKTDEDILNDVIIPQQGEQEHSSDEESEEPPVTAKQAFDGTVMLRHFFEMKEGSEGYLKMILELEKGVLSMGKKKQSHITDYFHN